MAEMKKTDKLSNSLSQDKRRSQGFDVTTQIVVICDPADPIITEFPVDMYQLEGVKWRFVQEPDELNAILHSAFSGFFIIALPSYKLVEWNYFIEFELKNYFSVYYYKSFFTRDLGQFLYLEFDFLVAGVERKKRLHSLLTFLIENYWKKIPLSLFQLENGSMTNTIRKVLMLFETNLDASELTLENIAQKLGINKNILRNELKTVLKISFTELRKQILQYYQDNYPQKIG